MSKVDYSIMTNCPNCGAPITGPVCEYCGTRHWGYQSGSAGSPVESMLSHGVITPNEARRILGMAELYDAKMELLKQQEIMRNLYDATIRAMRGYTSR